MTTVYRGARIFTADAPEWAEALVVDDDTITYVGDVARARHAAGSDPEVVDLDGGLILPGFVDAHAHVLQSGEAFLRADLMTAPDLSEIERRLCTWAESNPDAPRVLGKGWLFSSVPDGRPTRQMLDAAVPDRPAYLDANDYHSVWVNSAALAELGITDDTPDPAGGRIVRDKSGVATGVFEETALQEIVWPFLAKADTDAARDEQLAAVVGAYVQCGVTGAVDMALDHDALAAMARAEDAGTLPIRIAAHWLVRRAGDTTGHLEQVAEAARLAARHASPQLRVTGIKLIVDGVIDGCTAAMLEPYANGTNAEPIWDIDALAPVVAAADAAGLQVALHAIGDRAVRTAIDALEHAADVNGRRPRRHRIEHLEYVDQADVPRLAKAGITASMQPVHADPAIQETWRAVLGDGRVERGFAWPEMSGSGAHLAFGTDTPTAPYLPLHNLYVAATRRSAIDPAQPANNADLALPLADAIRHATRDAAWSCLAEDRRGRLAPGMLADFVAIDSDPFVSGAESLLTARTRCTVIGGRRYDLD